MVYIFFPFRAFSIIMYIKHTMILSEYTNVGRFRSNFNSGISQHISNSEHSYHDKNYLLSFHSPCLNVIPLYSLCEDGHFQKDNFNASRHKILYRWSERNSHGIVDDDYACHQMSSANCAVVMSNCSINSEPSSMVSASRFRCCREVPPKARTMPPWSHNGRRAKEYFSCYIRDTQHCFALSSRMRQGCVRRLTREPREFRLTLHTEGNERISCRIPSRGTFVLLSEIGGVYLEYNSQKNYIRSCLLLRFSSNANFDVDHAAVPTFTPDCSVA